MDQNLRSFRTVGPPHRQRDILRFLAAEGFEFEPEPFSSRCFRLLTEPRPLGSSLAAFFGHIYIQDRSSMLPPLALAPKEGEAVLDMCASPGGKTGFLADLLGPNGFVLANEPNSARLATLRANMRVLDLVNVASCQYAGADLPLAAASWNRILLDPPCSGWGTADKNPLARKLWQGKKIDQLVGIQRALLQKAASLLAPGGMLLYSTCTTNQDENGRQASFACSELELELVPLAPFPGFAFEDSELPGTLLVDGAASGAQGFFLALFRKNPAAMREEQPEMFACPPDARRLCHATACDLSHLPAGSVGVFSNKARFMPGLASSYLPRDFRWQGALIGSFAKNGNFQPQPRLKNLLPEEAALRLDEPAAIRSLLNGTLHAVDSNAEAAGLFWENLPLCRIRLRNGRAIPALGNE